MSYEKPRPTTGLFAGGVIGAVAAALLRAAAPVNNDVMVTLSVVVWLISVCVLAVAGYRFLAAFDAAALHRWQTVTSDKQKELRLKAEERTARAEAGGD
ncbi:MAG: hypothetical protein KDB60_17090 [Propionibacteriaceae bacterium]|nr:hypothetical protein [Propionibacteriaceae bacterium]